MLVAGKPMTYVDPFDRICHGLRTREKRERPATTDPKEALLSVAEITAMRRRPRPF